MKFEHYDVVVIGGGASGMMAAGVCASRGKKVLLLEQNKRLGEKLRISGGGRCNILNRESDEKKLLKKYSESEQFLYSPFSEFGMEATVSFFESKGLRLTVEAGNRAFPTSNKAEDVVRVLNDYMDAGGVTIRLQSPVASIISSSTHIEKILVGKESITADSYILATGGLSHPQTGSTGKGFTFLAQLGHSIKTPTPTIVPLKIKEMWIRELAGKSLPDVRITFYVSGKKKFSKRGTILCTHFGVGGPMILNLAASVSDLLHEGEVTAIVDLYPSVDLGILDKHISTIFDKNKNKTLKNVFKEITPAGTSDVLLSLIPSISPLTKVHSIRKEERRKLSELLKNITLSIDGLMGLSRAVVADGGVPLTEIDMKSMRSKKIDNLYITGDLLHVRRPSGGYSLQLCWTTGFVAGRNA